MKPAAVVRKETGRPRAPRNIAGVPPRTPATPWLAAILALALSACAYGPRGGEPRERRQTESPASVTSQIVVWRLAELATGDHEQVALQSQAGAHGMLSGSSVRLVARVADRVFAAAANGAAPEVLVAGLASVNAFAFVEDRRPTIAITVGMFRLLGNDGDAWAALLGHELAHLRLKHLQTLGEREKSAELASSLGGALLSAIGLPFGSVFADATSTLAQRAYSRDDEREADRTGLDYLRAAGFAADGAVRLQEQLLRAGAGQGSSFLSTHPGGAERIEALRELIRQGTPAR